MPPPAAKRASRAAPARGGGKPAARQSRDNARQRLSKNQQRPSRSAPARNTKKPPAKTPLVAKVSGGPAETSVMGSADAGSEAGGLSELSSFSTESLTKADGKEAVQLAWITAVLDKGVDGLADDYKKMAAAETMLPTTEFDKHPTKNRYANMKCWDETRVLVKKLDGEYIHANYVLDRDLILTQGPVKATLSDFWHMAWQERTCVIVMLCGLEEEGRRKCEEYWPVQEGGVLKLGPFTVTTVSRRPAVGAPEGEELVVSELSLVKEDKPDKPRRLVHFHYLSWPDRGVPASAAFLPSLQLQVRAVHSRYRTLNGLEPGMLSPWVVHCSAGIGRSGTFAAIYSVGRALAECGDKAPSSLKLVRRLRRERAAAVQNAGQYAFLHLVLLADLARQQPAPPDLAKFAADVAHLAKNPPPNPSPLASPSQPPPA